MKEQQEIDNMLHKIAIKNGEDCFITAIQALDRAREEMRGYLERFKEMETASEKTAVLSWATNHLASSLLSNARLDLMVSTAAEIARTEPQK